MVELVLGLAPSRHNTSISRAMHGLPSPASQELNLPLPARTNDLTHSPIGEEKAYPKTIDDRDINTALSETEGVVELPAASRGPHPSLYSAGDRGPPTIRIKAQKAQRPFGAEGINITHPARNRLAALPPPPRWEEEAPCRSFPAAIPTRALHEELNQTKISRRGRQKPMKEPSKSLPDRVAYKWHQCEGRNFFSDELTTMSPWQRESEDFDCPSRSPLLDFSLLSAVPDCLLEIIIIIFSCCFL
nr:unnamed protein product [Digitaria exilis]